VGIALVADPLGAGAATVAGALTIAAFVFGWRYFESFEAHFHALMLLFLAGMTGFALSGDLFDMFVFFELMSAVAYALTAVMCILQRHLKRLLAYSTIAHTGLFVMAFGTLDAQGTAGGALYAVGHAGIKGRCSSWRA
jgi:multicomponent Na+:H+ antiporter subunit D